MENKIRNYTNGLFRLKNSLDFAEIMNHGFEYVNSESWSAGNNTETEIDFFMKDGKKLIRIISTIETESEGTLTYQSTWVDTSLYNLFLVKI